MSIEDILQKGEGSTIEFKETLKADGILATLIAFANTSGGRLIIGVSDKTHHIVGIENPHIAVEGLASTIHDSIEPRILPNIEIIPYRKTHLILIEVYPSSLRPHYIKSKGKEKATYIRIGSTTRLADKDLLQVIERSTFSKSFDEELIYETNCEDIDFTAASQLFDDQRKLQQSDLVSLGVLAKKGKELIPTVGGVLLFGKNRLQYFPDAWIQVGAFEGTEKEHILDTINVVSLFPYAIDEILHFIKKNMRIGLRIEDIRHQEVWEVPKIALREAIINAIVHTDYSLRGAPIRVSIFDDRIQIENSALLPWGLTFEDLKEGVSKLRNPILARVFKELGLIEQWGSGIKRMTKACIEAGLEEPEFKEIGPRIRVTFYKEKLNPAIIDNTDNFILSLLGFCGSLSSHQITSCMNISRRSVINRLSGLVDKGQIREISQGPNDPKKRYTLSKAIDKTQKMKMVKNIEWLGGSGPLGTLIVRIELGQNHLNLLFSREVIREHPTLKDIGTDTLEEGRASATIKDVLASEPEILLKALADEEVQGAFKRRELAKYDIKEEDYHGKSFR